MEYKKKGENETAMEGVNKRGERGQKSGENTAKKKKTKSERIHCSQRNRDEQITIYINKQTNQQRRRGTARKKDKSTRTASEKKKSMTAMNK